MANLQPPPRQVADISPKKKITRVKPVESTTQTPPDAIKPLQLKIPEVKKNEFKAYAAMRGLSMNTLFLDMFEQYKKQN